MVASDGMTDVLSDQDAADFILDLMKDKASAPKRMGFDTPCSHLEASFPATHLAFLVRPHLRKQGAQCTSRLDCRPTRFTAFFAELQSG